MKTAGLIGSVLGIALLLVLALRADLPAMLHTLEVAGAAVLWLVPYRAVYFLLFALGWLYMLRPYDAAHRIGLGYAFWVTTVREAIDRLLPVASVGGGVAGVRLTGWRGIEAAQAGATVIVEIVLTLIAAYAFTALGLILLSGVTGDGGTYRSFLIGFLVTLPAPVGTFWLLRHGSVFKRLHAFARPVIGDSAMSDGAQDLDREIGRCLARWRVLVFAGTLQFVALVSGSMEIWFALRLFGHPIGAAHALVLESLMQAMRHVAFIVPGGIGVQEAALVLLGHTFGINGDLSLAVSMAKRIREVLCGVPALLSWQWMEARRLHAKRVT